MFLIFFVAIIPIKAPTGKAISGSTVILIILPNDNKIIETKGPIIEANKLGNSS